MGVVTLNKLDTDPVGPLSEVVVEGEPGVPADPMTELATMEAVCPPVAKGVPGEVPDGGSGLRANPCKCQSEFVLSDPALNIPTRFPSTSKTAYTFFRNVSPKSHWPETISFPKTLLVHTPLAIGETQS